MPNERGMLRTVWLVARDTGALGYKATKLFWNVVGVLTYLGLVAFAAAPESVIPWPQAQRVAMAVSVWAGIQFLHSFRLQERVDALERRVEVTKWRQRRLDELERLHARGTQLFQQLGRQGLGQNNHVLFERWQGDIRTFLMTEYGNRICHECLGSLDEGAAAKHHDPTTYRMAAISAGCVAYLRKLIDDDHEPKP